MTPEEFERAQDARITPWQPDAQLLVSDRGEPITLGFAVKPQPGSLEAAVVGQARAAIMTASWTSACAVKTERNHGPR